MKAKKTKKKRAEAHKYYVMFGFEEADPTHTAYLKVDPSGRGDHGLYMIVDYEEFATKFPAKNYFKKRGFGTPYDWAKFFAEEDELQDWNFHPVPCK